ncbi:MAG: hypothetical protein PHS40_12220, partial [Mariniphaga sp.]|nr:hypothetical protein [Mariniphaga sp.]
PDELNNIAKPWYDNPIEGSTQGKFGEIMDETLFYALIKISDSHNALFLFANQVRRFSVFL